MIWRRSGFIIPMTCLVWIFVVVGIANASEFLFSIGETAASQVLREAAKQILATPKHFDLYVGTHEDPLFDNLAEVSVDNRLVYGNLSVRFHDRSIHVLVNDMTIVSNSNFSAGLWPLATGDQLVDVNVQMEEAELSFDMNSGVVELTGCRLAGAQLATKMWDNYVWDRAVSGLLSYMGDDLNATICELLRMRLAKIEHRNVMRFPVSHVLPEKIGRVLVSNHTSLYYRLKSVDVAARQLIVRAQLEWSVTRINAATGSPFEFNTTVAELELREDDRVTAWIEDSIINDLIQQVEWSFEWMVQQIPVSSAAIPPDSRQFLSTLCQDCFFLLNVSAHGAPTITATTNGTFLLEKRDRVNLRVVNPERNTTAVFVAFLLTVNAEIQPFFDNGILRTLVQLLDTHIEMQSGAFPKHWAAFMQDLIRGLIMDMMWPETRKVIEELMYAKGVRVARTCGLDPPTARLSIEERAFSVSARLALNHLDPHACLASLKASLPNTSKLFPKRRR